MNTTVLLLSKIETCRKEMIALSNTYGLTSHQVIQSSKKLDELLNRYEQIQKINTSIERD